MRAIEDTRGEFIVPLDSDDYLHPEAIAVWMQYRSEHPQYVVIYSGFYRVDTENTMLYEVLPHQQRNEPVEGNILATLLNGNTVTASTSLIERARLLEVGGYVSKATLHNGRGHDDYFLMLRLAAAGYAFGYVARPLLYYRDTPNSISKDTIPFVAKDSTAETLSLKQCINSCSKRWNSQTRAKKQWPNSSKRPMRRSQNANNISRA